MTQVQTEALGPLRGTVVTQYIRCSKPECHCMKGGPRHGPYYYRMWREGEKIVKQYVHAADVERVRAQCDLYHGYQDRLRDAKAKQEASEKILRREMRLAERLIRNRKAM